MYPYYFFIINQIVFILMNAIGIWCAYLTYITDRKAKVNQYCSRAWVCLILWMDLFFISIFGPFLAYQKEILISQLSIKAVILLTGPMLIYAYFFMLYFPVESKRNYLFDKVYAFIWIILSFLAFTDLVAKRVEFEGLQLRIIGGELMNFFLLAAAISILLIMRNLFKKYFLLPKEEKIKVRYFAAGIFIIGVSIIIFLTVIPILRGGNFVDNPVYFLLVIYSVFFANFFAAYAILNKKLFNISVILTQLLVVVMGILLLITPFLINILWLKILLVFVFLLFCVFGWLIIRSSIRETRQKEILEQMVRERTKELQASKEELEKKVQDLEKWYKLNVGRSSRMAELKQKIKELESEVKGKDKDKET